MKKILNLVMAAAVVLTLAGCGDKTGEGMDSQGTGPETGRQEAGQDTGKEVGQSTGQEVSQEVGLDGSPAQGNDNAGNPEVSQGVSDAQQTETSAEAAGLRDDYEDNFDVDEAAAAEFARMIKEAVAQKNVEMLADLTGFPVYVGLSGGTVVETRDDFVGLDVEELLPEEMLSSIAEADENSLSPSMAGFTLYGSDGAPSITFGVRDGSLKISGINYGY